MFPIIPKKYDDQNAFASILFKILNSHYNTFVLRTKINYEK